MQVTQEAKVTTKAAELVHCYAQQQKQPQHRWHNYIAYTTHFPPNTARSARTKHLAKSWCNILAFPLAFCIMLVANVVPA